MDNNEEAVKAFWGICHGMSRGLALTSQASALGMHQPEYHKFHWIFVLIYFIYAATLYTFPRRAVMKLLVMRDTHPQSVQFTGLCDA